ncbi:hypothetical protein [Nitrosomonas ureae]|uniref:Cobalamin ABC transporter n=1 Tax=Nitrosomonas ureae TaxID=44577 RepID=A0A286AC61_9PROT|nr:hypothetical protein [Nitrosomonas ureae]SOD19490.1 hypothetical protein SAMN06297164_2489 [Nitrosomonas ureae]
MLILSIRSQISIGLLLVLLMIFTRSHHFASIHNMADASWAIFFFAGVYLRSTWPFLGFFTLSWWLDFAATHWGGVSDYCLTPAYVFLLPAYVSLWLTGRWYRARYQFAWSTLLPLSISVITGLTLCQLFSGGGFYFFSGRIAETNFNEFGEQLIKYFPLYVETFVFYLSIAVVIHTFLILISQQFNSNNAAG